MKKSKIIPGQTYGKLTITERDASKLGRKPFWFCQCECGNQSVVRADYLTSGKIISCGCYRDSKFKASPENIKQCKELFDQGKSINEIAGLMRISPSNVQKFLSTSGVETEFIARKKLEAYREEDKLRWAKKYVIFKMSLSAIAEGENTTTASISKALNKLGILMREPGSQSAEMISRFKAKADEYWQFYKDGMSSVDIAELFDVSSPNAVLYILKAHGYKIRTNQEVWRNRRVNFRKQTRSLIKNRGVKLSETRKVKKLRDLEESK